MCDKVCWTCGHYAFGCFVIGKYNSHIDANYTCDNWCPEGTKGTVTDFNEMNDGTMYSIKK